MVVAVDGTLNPGSPRIDASAYDNNVPNATSTTLYNLDFQANRLFRQIPPNDGTQVAVGDLGVMIDANNGFDIGGVSNNAFALLRTGGRSGIYTINLSTGKATLLSPFSAPAHSFALGLGF
jgi:hypothetical protein